jgi:predicted ATPase
VTNLLGYLADYNPEALRLIEEDLGGAVDDFDGFEFQPAGSANEQQFIVRFTGWPHPIEAPQLSDGTLNMIGLVAVLRSPRQFPILCLEEPENGLTPKAISALVRSMTSGARTPDGQQAQLIVSTHSPFLVSAIMSAYATRQDAEDVGILVIQHDHQTRRTEVRPFEAVAEEAGFDPTYEPGPDAIARIMAHLYA